MKRRTLLAAIAAAGIARAASGEPAPRVRGRSVLLGGAPVALRGVAVGDAWIAREGRAAQDYDILARDWKANLVRISIHPFLWRADRGRALSALEGQVTSALAAGLSVIIVWHAIGWPGGTFEKPHASRFLPEDAYDSDLDLARDFWTKVADRFGDAPRVIFEIWNEPVWLDGGARDWGRDWTELRPVWEEFLALIRARSGNLLLVTGGSWASDLTGVRDAPLEGDNIGYSWHVYPGTASGDFSRLGELLDELPRSHPVFVTEWGFDPGAQGHLSGTADGFGHAFAAQFLRRYAMNWSAWCWNPDWQPPLIESDWRTPTPAGAFVRQLLEEA